MPESLQDYSFASVSNNQFELFAETNTKWGFRCEICGKVFSRLRYLKQHRRAHRDPQIRCSCGQLFRWRAGYRTHLKTCPSVNEDALPDTDATVKEEKQ